MTISIRARLSVMMGLQYFIWGSWLPLIYSYLPSLGFTPAGQSWILNAFPIAAVIGLFFSNQFADRHYKDDLNSPVLVLGDSFLRIFEQDEPGSAGFVAHLAKELNQPLASLVNDGGASTLVRRELYRRPALLQAKQVVIWEFVERDIRLGTEGWQRVPLPPKE